MRLNFLGPLIFIKLAVRSPYILYQDLTDLYMHCSSFVFW